MIVTEKEAKEMICHRKLGSPVIAMGSNITVGNSPTAGYCHGSECMAWVWKTWDDDGNNVSGQCGLLLNED